jgi:hypothetical protein
MGESGSWQQHWQQLKSENDNHRQREQQYKSIIILNLFNQNCQKQLKRE